VVDVSMLDAMAYFDSPDLFAGHTSADDRPDRGLLQHLESVRPLRTNDGWMVVSPVSGRQLSATVRAAGHPEWSQDLKTATNVTEMTTILYDRLDTVMTSRSTAEWEKVFDEADVPVSEFLDMDAHILDLQVHHNDLYRTAYDPILGEVRRARAPCLFDGTVVQTDDLPVPRLP
jgi:crotonobetainyl-CoA:carnitine CoA-transferase CaiB-like acyl-CoA transferase